MRSFLIMLLVTSMSLAADKAEYPLLVSEDFEKGAERWQPTDPKAWKIDKTEKGQVYNQHKKSKYKPPHRSPFNISLLKELTVSNFTLHADLQSTIKDYGHRDMCLFFGFQNPGHFYYVHLGKKTDDHANQIFIVNGKARTKISTKTTPGTNWDDDWHKVKIVRNVETGSIEVYFDNMKKPVMTATDKTFTHGQVGVGSFDDTGRWDNIKLFGNEVK